MKCTPALGDGSAARKAILRPLEHVGYLLGKDLLGVFMVLEGGLGLVALGTVPAADRAGGVGM